MSASAQRRVSTLQCSYENCSGYVIVVAGRIVDFNTRRKASLRLDEKVRDCWQVYISVDGVVNVIDIFPKCQTQVGSCQIEHNGQFRRFQGPARAR